MTTLQVLRFILRIAETQTRQSVFTISYLFRIYSLFSDATAVFELLKLKRDRISIVSQIYINIYLSQKQGVIGLPECHLISMKTFV